DDETGRRDGGGGGVGADGRSGAGGPRSARRMPAGEAFRAAGLEPVRLKAKEGLALNNGTQAMTGVGTL
ncbi:MAG: aromatic amino acid lyase, partial [Gemmatimonadetes bacterium]|nr:aromatic amino acid lyase [Gemmatimonadota bacterium]NIQ52728.1 aromatic amino acid lyase [Gemmatimonadota bacterium]NIU72868.1 aromatic amino acid lyase [Gammaproteobacteria bacterium]NIX43229.1 aromatic amino acid lyase [Gemmatimonadota bacterium]NIY07403.1 aromatic amino acid lyase [Gemmatimonadota bacterium]